MSHTFFLMVWLLVVALFMYKTIKIVPQHQAWVVERLGRYDRTIQAGLNFVVPFIDHIAYQHALNETALEIPAQTFITADNAPVQVAGTLYYQIIDTYKASYEIKDFLTTMTQLTQNTLHTEINKLEIKNALKEREFINRSIVNKIQENTQAWGIAVLRFEISKLDANTWKM